MSVRAGLANVERGDVGVRRAQQQPAQQQQSNADLERYNAILESERFQHATPLQQLATVASWNLPAEQKAPLMASIKANMREQHKVKQYNRLLQSESFQEATPLQQLTTVASWDLPAEQKAPLIATIKTNMRQQWQIAKYNRSVQSMQPDAGALPFEKQVAFSSKYMTGQYAGTSTPKPRDMGFVETDQGLKAIDWQGYTPTEREALRGYLVAEGRQRLLNLGLFVTAPLTFVAAPVAATFGAGVSVGVSQGFKAIQGGGWLTPGEALVSAGEGAVFSYIGSSAVRAMSYIAPKIATGLAGGASRIDKVIGLGSRALINAGVDAAQAAIISGGDVEQIKQATVFGGVFSVGFDVVGYAGAHLKGKVSVPKYGRVKVPLEGGGEAQWRGLYLSKGEKAKPLTGKWRDAPDTARILSHGPGGEAAGYVPESNIEAKLTVELMKKTGYGPGVIQDVEDSLGLMSATKDTRSKFIKDLLPTETQTLSAKGVGTVKDFVLANSEDVEKLYGSFTQRAQVSEGFEYIVETAKGQVSALRQPADIDIQLKVGKEQAEAFTETLVTKLTGAGETVKISTGKSTLIESSKGGTWRHAVDIHAVDDLEQMVPAKGWGFNIPKKPVKIEKITSQALNEQGLAKGVSVLGFTEESGIGPVAHRAKDVPDFLQIQRTLLESKPVASVADFARLTRLASRFSVTDTQASAAARSEYIFGSIKQSRGGLSSFGAAVFPSRIISPFPSQTGRSVMRMSTLARKASFYASSIMPSLSASPSPSPSPSPSRSSSPAASMFRMPSGFKFESSGFESPPLLRRQKIRGRKRVYPILTGEEVLSLSLPLHVKRRRR